MCTLPVHATSQSKETAPEACAYGQAAYASSCIRHTVSELPVLVHALFSALQRSLHASVFVNEGDAVVGTIVGANDPTWSGEYVGNAVGVAVLGVGVGAYVGSSEGVLVGTAVGIYVPV